MAKSVSLRLPHDEALLLYHFLLRYTTRHEHEIEDNADMLALDAACLALCEKLRHEIDEQYESRLDAARERLNEARQQRTEFVNESGETN